MVSSLGAAILTRLTSSYLYATNTAAAKCIPPMPPMDKESERRKGAGCPGCGKVEEVLKKMMAG